MLDVGIFIKQLDLQPIIERMLTMEQVECPVTHHFADGQYMRETLMPKDSLVIGEKHKHSTINILLKGKLSVFQGEGNPVLEIEAPHTWVSEAGVQKVGYCHSDVIIANLHPTDETDVDKIKDIFIDNKIKEVE